MMRQIELPEGYRLLVASPGLRVLIDVREGGRVVGRYQDTVDLRDIDRDARDDFRSRHSDARKDQRETPGKRGNSSQASSLVPIYRPISY